MEVSDQLYFSVVYPREKSFQYPSDRRMVDKSRSARSSDEEKQSCLVGFEVLTAVVMKNTILWDITPCSPLKVNLLLATCLHAGFLLGLFFGPENGGDMFLRNVG
jgi:hypothetical protein